MVAEIDMSSKENDDPLLNEFLKSTYPCESFNKVCMGKRVTGGKFTDGSVGVLCVGHDPDGNVNVCAIKDEDKRQFTMKPYIANEYGVVVIQVSTMACLAAKEMNK